MLGIEKINNKSKTNSHNNGNDSRNNESSNVFLKRIPEKLIKNTKKSNIKCILIPDKESKNGFAHIRVKECKIFRSTKENGVPMTGFKNINLGNAECDLKCSIIIDYDADKKPIFKSDTIKAREVVEKWGSEKEEYFRNQPDAKGVDEVSNVNNGEDSGNCGKFDPYHSSYVFPESANDKNDGDELDY